MRAGRVRVTLNRFPELAARLAPAGEAATRASAERLADRIRDDVRRDTGELRDSIEVTKTEAGFAVTASADQALSEEFGTSRQAPHPTFAPAAEAERGAFVTEVRDEIGRRLR